MPMIHCRCRRHSRISVARTHHAPRVRISAPAGSATPPTLEGTKCLPCFPYSLSLSRCCNLDDTSRCRKPRVPHRPVCPRRARGLPPSSDWSSLLREVPERRVSSVRLAMKRRLFRHTWAPASSSEVVESDSFLSIPFMSRHKDSAPLTAAGLSILTRGLWSRPADSAETGRERLEGSKEPISVVRASIGPSGFFLKNHLYMRKQTTKNVA